jgi:hypothetical protein
MEIVGFSRLPSPNYWSRRATRIISLRSLIVSWKIPTRTSVSRYLMRNNKWQKVLYLDTSGQDPPTLAQSTPTPLR